MISRRRWLQLLGLSGFGSVLVPARLGANLNALTETNLLPAREEPDSLPAFEEIPSAQSGISWTKKSSARFLMEPPMPGKERVRYGRVMGRL